MMMFGTAISKMYSYSGFLSRRGQRGVCGNQKSMKLMLLTGLFLILSVTGMQQDMPIKKTLMDIFNEGELQPGQVVRIKTPEKPKGEDKSDEKSQPSTHFHEGKVGIVEAIMGLEDVKDYREFNSVVGTNQQIQSLHPVAQNAGKTKYIVRWGPGKHETTTVSSNFLKFTQKGKSERDYTIPTEELSPSEQEKVDAIQKQHGNRIAAVAENLRLNKEIFDAINKEPEEHKEDGNDSDDPQTNNPDKYGPDLRDFVLQEHKLRENVKKIGKGAVVVGSLSALTAVGLGFGLGFDPTYMAKHVGDVAFGDVNGAYIFVVVFGLLAVVTILWSVCHWNVQNKFAVNIESTGRKWAIAALVAGLFSVAGTVTFSALAATNTQVGTMDVGNVGGTGIMIVGFSVLAVIAITWGLCCWKRRHVCGKTAHC